nr:hypothetical protein CFP56_31319 [Quercus suber]
MDVEKLDVLSSEESDLLIRSMKKQKTSSHSFCPEFPLLSYKDSLIQQTRDWEDHFIQNLRITDTDIDSDQDDDSNDSSPLILLSKEDKLRDLQCIALGLDYFLIRFKLNEDYWKVLNEGPWFIGQQFLSVKQWSPRFKPSEAKLTTTAIWAKLLKLPVELYDGSILRRIGNQIGNLLKINARTVDNIRGRFCQTLHSSRLGLSPHLQSSHRLSGATRLI